MLHLLWTALIGLIVGALAKLIIPGKDPGGIFITMLIGIAGSFLGTFLGRAIGHYEPDQSAGFLQMKCKNFAELRATEDDRHTALHIDRNHGAKSSPGEEYL